MAKNMGYHRCTRQDRHTEAATLRQALLLVPRRFWALLTLPPSLMPLMSLAMFQEKRDSLQGVSPVA